MMMMRRRSRRTVVRAVRTLFVVLLPTAAVAQESPLIYFDQPESAKIFEQAAVKNDFWTLSRFFVAEKYLTYCGIASSVAVLNSLNVPSPVAPLIYPYQIFTEQNIFTEEALKVKPVLDIEQQGLTLEELARLLDVQGVRTKYAFGPDVSAAEFRDQARAALEASDQRLIVNYSRQAVGQKGDGHISPVAAYDADSDRFLVLDVARYKYPAAWITTADLYQALQAEDSGSGKPRGFVVVSR